MKYVKLTFQYLTKKHFLKLLLCVLLPAIVLAFLKSFSKTAAYIVNFYSQSGSSFSDVFISSTRFDWIGLAKGVATVLLISLVGAFLVGTITRHIRTGKLDVSKILTRINENFFQVLITVFALAIGLVLFGLINSAFITLWLKVCARKVVALVLSLLTNAILFFIAIVTISSFSLWTPIMAMTGQPIFTSLATSIRETRSHSFFSFFIGVLLPLVPAFLIVYLVSLSKVFWVILLGDILFYIIILLYYPVFVVVSYCDVFGLDREDLLAANRF